MHLVTRGPAEATPLILIHGFGVDHRLLLPLDPVIDTVGGWRRIYLDLPGHGASPIGSVASAEDVVTAVHQVIAEQVGEARFAMLGNSFGAMLARRIAHDRRDQLLGLALIAPVIVPAHRGRDVPSATVLRTDAAAIDSLGDAGPSYREITAVQSPATARAFAEFASPGQAAADTPALERIAERYSLTGEPEASHPFTAPTLIVTGRQDQIVGYRDAWRLLEHYPRATFAVLDGAGHNTHLEQPGPVAGLLTDWLRRVRELP